MYGVNPSSQRSHRRFAQEQSLPFPLLVDQGARIARAYRCGFWRIVRRTVYVIGPQGRIVFARRGAPSPEQILAALQIPPQHP